jgi:hypothetical protein
MSSDKPISSFFLVSIIIPRYFDTQIAISEFLGHKIVSSLFSTDMFSKSQSKDDILPRKQFLFKDIVLQTKIECISSSKKLPSQYKHFLSSKGVM